MQDNQSGVIISRRNGFFTAEASWHGARTTLGASFKTEAEARIAGEQALERLREIGRQQ